MITMRILMSCMIFDAMQARYDEPSLLSVFKAR